ncbi:MAG: hypothetical protein LBI54_06745, partial [Lachnospiraceae bacterium]|nr:hypothetical protein [Lachnospiraceae bacterium]
MLKRFINLTNIARVAVAAFSLSLLPLLYASFFNRATGDDFGFGILTRRAWVSSGSLTEVVKAALATVRTFYYEWQGTWFSIF